MVSTYLTASGSTGPKLPAGTLEHKPMHIRGEKKKREEEALTIGSVYEVLYVTSQWEEGKKKCTHREIAG